MKDLKYNRTRLACYIAYFTMSSVFSLPPLLFVTFHEMYGVSYTLLGTLVLTNFCTQLGIDLMFTIFSKYFNIHMVVKCMPLITTLGLAIYAFAPVLFPNAVYVGLLIGTMIFSVSAGLSEVLLSPVIAALPSEHPERDMSMLHSLYAFGVFFVVMVSTAFLSVFGNENWRYLTLIFAALPVMASVLFMLSPMPDMSLGGHSAEGTEGVKRRSVGLAFCVACIFFGSCAENVMSNWISGYMENALFIDKALGDILGMALFAILLGLVRITYAKYGKHVFVVLFVGMVGATCCYLIAAFVTNSVVVLIACAMTGLFTSMLWPGALIFMEENLPGIGVVAYALMAAGGDFGASIAPQLMGIVVDRVSASALAQQWSATLGFTAEQIGMKTGMLVTSLFPMIGAIVLLFAIRYFKKSVQPARE